MKSAPLRVTYRLRAGGDIQKRARALALEQSIETPLAAVTDPRVLDEVVAQVERIEVLPDGSALAHLALSAETIAGDAGQLMNMLFGNSSLLDDVQIEDIAVPSDMAQTFEGPALGIEGLRRLVGAGTRALTCTALKPIGSSVGDLAQMAATFAAAGIDIIKDDHGWAPRARATFEQRVVACQREVERINRGRASRSAYAPALAGDAEAMREQLHFAQSHGVGAVLVTPMIAGASNFNALRREFPAMAFIAHPALAGNQIAPAALLGVLFRVFGADAVIFPNHGGRFSYTRATCLSIAARLREPLAGLRSALPVPAGGMSVERVPEIVADYGRDSMLLIGGNLLMAREQLAERSREFVQAVAAATSTVAT
ncbi:MAG TPA: RuBisCO large subunit C-terminal-like domain-containing protein [Burkholderiaceae bacterium]|nr:RuBisCO large subunit C-terminal-like domain-containing protein [Burkholderiaceae bacterium]